MTALRVTRWGLVLLVSLLVVVLWRPAASLPLRTVALGTVPWQLVVNQRAQRAFIYTATQRGNIVSVLDTAKGALLHTVQVGGTLLFDSNELQFDVARLLAVDEQTQRVFVDGQQSDGQGQVSVLDARSGALLRTVVLGPHLNQTGAIGVDEQTRRVFVLGQGLDGHGKVSVLEARSGRLLRTLSVGVDPIALAVDAPEQRVFVKSYLGTVTILDARTGTLLRTVPVAAAGGTVTVAARTGRVFVSGLVTGPGGSVGTVHMLAARSGRQLRTVTLPSGAGAMAVDERAGRVYVVAPAQAEVAVLDARSGTLLHRAAVGEHPVAVAVNPQTGHVLVSALGPTNSAGEVTSDGSVSVLDGRTLVVQRTLTVGAAPADLAVDEPSGHTLVVNSNYNPSDCSLAYVPVPEAGWVQGLRWLQQRLGWLPLRAPQPPVPITHGSVMLLDSARV